MMRVVVRGFLIVLALVLIVASAGTVLCERDCAADGHAASAAAMAPMNVGISHCDGEQSDSSARDLSTHHRSSGGNTRHGAHLHSGIVATVTARVSVSPVIAFLGYAVASVGLRASVISRADENSWNNNSSPPTSSSSVFATGVLRI